MSRPSTEVDKPVDGDAGPMEKWTYLMIKVADGGGGRQYVLQPHVGDLEANLHSVGAGFTVALLDELGDRGWELLSVDVPTETYWLKKRVVEAPGDEVTAPA